MSIGITCPACHSYSIDSDRKKISMADFDIPSLYSPIYLVTCRECGHIFNQPFGDTLDKLDEFYSKYHRVNSINPGEGYTPGKSGGISDSIYHRIYQEIYYKCGTRKDLRILDVGCSGGGFLKYLKARGYSHLYGIDFVIHPEVGIHLLPGSASKIPFKDDMFDVVVIHHVLEHVYDLQKAMDEITRVMKDTGKLIVVVPDAEGYEETSMGFPDFWFIIREHLHHFCCYSLLALGRYHELSPVYYDRYVTPSVSGDDSICNLLMIFEHGKINRKLWNKHGYIWGISKEFFYLYSNSSMGRSLLENISLVDDNTYKQYECTFKGKPIISSADIDYSNPDVFVLITAVAHTRSIVSTLKKRGFKGRIITLV